MDLIYSCVCMNIQFVRVFVCVSVCACMLWSIRDNSVYCDTRNAVTAATAAVAAAGAFVVVLCSLCLNVLYLFAPHSPL